VRTGFEIEVRSGWGIGRRFGERRPYGDVDNEYGNGIFHTKETKNTKVWPLAL
jgi:hypothetical protein